MPYKDIEKRREAGRRCYRKYAEKNRKRAIERRKKIRDWYYEFKSTLKCNRCSESHPACLEFHHNENKEMAIAQAVRNAWSIEKIKNEIKKCLILCSNCHKKKHYNEGYINTLHRESI